MSRIKSLRQAKADTIAEMKALNEKLGDPKLSEEDRTKHKAAFKALEAKLDTNAEDLAREERMQALEKTAPTVDDAEVGAAGKAARAAGLIEVGADRKALDKKLGYRSLAAFANDVRQACVPGGRAPERLVNAMKLAQLFAAPSNVSQEGGTSEGYEVPSAYADQIFQLVFAPDGLLESVAPEPTLKNAVDIEGDESTPWGATGVQAKWRAEGVQMSGSKASTNLRTVRLHELFAFVTASAELLDDAPRLNDRLTTKAAAAIKWKADEALMFGTGAGQPLGWMTSNALVTVAIEAAQATNTILTANILKMYSRLLRQGGSPFWALNPDTLPQLGTITIGQQPAFTPPMAGIVNAPNGMLLGLPIKWSEHSQTLGTKGDVQLINPIGYYATTKAADGDDAGTPGLDFASSIHLYFDYNLTAFRWTFRLGGEPFLSAPVTPGKGASNKSHFVTLAARP